MRPKAFTLTPSKANIIPVRYLMLVDTNGTSTSIGASIKLGHTANSYASVRDRILWKCPDLFQHSLRRADSLTNENVIRALLPSPDTLNSLFFGMLFPQSKNLPCDNCRDTSPKKGPPHIRHRKLRKPDFCFPT